MKSAFMRMALTFTANCAGSDALFSSAEGPDLRGGTRRRFWRKYCHHTPPQQPAKALPTLPCGGCKRARYCALVGLMDVALLRSGSVLHHESLTELTGHALPPASSR